MSSHYIREGVRRAYDTVYSNDLAEDNAVRLMVRNPEPTGLVDKLEPDQILRGDTRRSDTTTQYR